MDQVTAVSHPKLANYFGVIMFPSNVQKVRKPLPRQMALLNMDQVTAVSHPKLANYFDVIVFPVNPRGLLPCHHNHGLMYSNSLLI
jgi:transcriptional antiterminator Rof (Rho-off)